MLRNGDRADSKNHIHLEKLQRVLHRISLQFPSLLRQVPSSSTNSRIIFQRMETLDDLEDRRCARAQSWSQRTDFEQDVITTDIHGNNFRAVALLDTGCHHGNWISKRLVQDLGKLCEISPAPSTTTAVSLDGRVVMALGVIDLQWKWNRGTRYHLTRFYVLSSSGYLDMVLGREFIQTESLLLRNESVFLVLVQHKKNKKGDKSAIAAEKERQRKEKAALKEWRKQAKQGDSSQEASQQFVQYQEDEVQG